MSGPGVGGKQLYPLPLHNMQTVGDLEHVAHVAKDAKKLRRGGSSPYHGAMIALLRNKGSMKG